MKVLYFDCFSGASGDMIVGALIDAGVPLEEIRRALGSLSIDRNAVWTERVQRAGIGATKFQVRGEDAGDGHPHHHHGGGGAVATEAHVHRTLPEIYSLIDGSRLSAAGKDRAKALFARLGDVEGTIHGTPPEQVHLHEVGALDSIVDIVSTVHALELVGADRIVASPINVGSGTIRSSHGLYPVPAPATIRLLEGAPIYSGTQRAEMVTPTGALLVTSYATEFGGIPAMTIANIGYGAGARSFDDTPNVLRVLIGEADRAAPSHTVVVIEAEIDDMNPQIFGVLMDKLLAAGALDVFYTPIQMKKNRPGTLLSVIAPPPLREVLTSTIFRETTTIGVRHREMARECLDRETHTVTTPFGPVRFKIARRNGEILNAAPEFEDCVHLANQHGRPIKEIQAAAIKAFHH
ncbi:MAG TPA: nickel pincer cofactor biosynthesis protein LarC [Vicinamibacterales bacterium]|nr:nickel pincer cofactor biosynthesis protein LarC [Vicinamibacterales bacterium]